ncbi:transcriptional regulator, AlpA family [Bryocella elongata]|uniref:Transcriptional regulator, AlpA family n=1 Tax=Bryocella elongata TaxID=863522 RepID=A0A1H6B5Z9_9BACT|nr:AlpA family transcriptional regulator [Bryocella elongata]SEG55825.1 transcriptional regulator, AlpA family [Bryocella elongata]
MPNPSEAIDVDPTPHQQAAACIPNRILRLPAVMAATGLRTTTIYMRMRDGSFPKAVSLGGKSVGWRAREIDAWCASRMSVSAQ